MPTGRLLMTTWLITGCSTGLGRALAHRVLAEGHNAVITARDTTALTELTEAYPDSALAVPLDVRNAEQIDSAVEAARQQFGSIDVLVNNAGYGYRAAVEEGEADTIRDLFDTNYFGAVNMINAVLPTMREQRNGVIINISSIAGQRSAAGSGHHAASTAARESTSEALRQEAAPLGIRGAIVQPGPFRTDFFSRSLQRSETAMDAYAETAGKRRKENAPATSNQPGDPERAAAAIMQLAQLEEPPMRLVLGRAANQMAEKDLNQQLDDLMEWEHLGLATDYPVSAE